jgi:hypothetical protein
MNEIFKQGLKEIKEELDILISDGILRQDIPDDLKNSLKNLRHRIMDYFKDK